VKWTWRDADEIAGALINRYPESNPLGVSLAQLREFVLTLPEFGDDPDAVSIPQLEAIQGAWYDRFES
jgi:FeS assembly protein IscX